MRVYAKWRNDEMSRLFTLKRFLWRSKIFVTEVPAGQLWMAPEILRDTSMDPNNKTDVYAFSIIASEIITRKPAWNMQERGESLDGEQ